LATSQNKSIIYLAQGRASFVNQDIQYLEDEFDLTPYYFSGRSKWLVPLEIVKLFLFLLTRRKQDFLISFGGYHSFVATLVAKWKGARSFIILNGTDSVTIPEFHYGHLRKGLLKWCCKKSYQSATKLLPVSDSLIATTNNYAFDGRQLGLNAVFPQMGLNYRVIPNGFNLDFWSNDNQAKSNSILTVATANRIPHKGVDLIIEAASKMKNYTFSIAGIDHLENCPENVFCLGYLSLEELREVYSNHQYYLQLSIWEGFGCALCEAMLCGCIPIVSSVNILPEIVGNEMLVVSERSAEALVEKIKKINSSSFMNFADKIKERFPIEKRIALLKQEIAGE